MRTQRRAASFTLVEAMVALAVLGIAVAALLTPTTVAIQQKTRAMKQTQAVILAEQLIEEVVSQDCWSYDEWAVLGPSGGETWRSGYDEVSDYHGVVETSGQFGPINGPVLSSGDFPPNMSRSMWLQYYYLPGERGFYPPDFMLLTVRVYDGDQELVTLRRLVRNDDHDKP